MSGLTAKPAAKEEAPVAIRPRNRKGVIALISLSLTLVAGGAGLYLARNHLPTMGHAEPVQTDARLVALSENFTVNLQREEGDHNLQTGITLKVRQPEWAAKIKAAQPEIRSRLLLLLSSKKPSELLTPEGKKKLIDEILAETDIVLGLPPRAETTAVVPNPETGAPEATSVPAAVAAPAAPPSRTAGVTDVLFTSFFIR